ncbi:pantothenate transporter liz1 [Ophiostoma piceae UAMH 11346]|uniref:Pantothenate transporter liz1 n=1 Tax=Ophiostoma piceae (strain UAMH 11346) TaxID=1262450 RepID=S3BSW6_OPHP1|nr:pantothenate transporter liz1 [Ophiostoma piceae UAMH 11346]
MQEDLGLSGYQYTYAQPIYTVAYATFALAGVHSAGRLYASRFLVGLFESSFSPSMLYLLGTWYTKEERAKHIALFLMTAPLSTTIGGYMEAAEYKTLNGAHGSSP